MDFAEFIIQEAQIKESAEYGGTGCSPNEYMFLYAFAMAIRANTIVEIGGRNGGATVWLAKALQDRGRKNGLLSVDKNPQGLAKKRAEKLGVVDIIEFQQGLSEDIVKTWNKKRCIDLLWIDANHTVLGVGGDYVLWTPYVRENGYVIFHDATTNHILHQVNSFVKCIARMMPVIWLHTGGPNMAICQLDKEHPVS